MSIAALFAKALTSADDWQARNSPISDSLYSSSATDRRLLIIDMSIGLSMPCGSTKSKRPSSVSYRFNWTTRTRGLYCVGCDVYYLHKSVELRHVILCYWVQYVYVEVLYLWIGPRWNCSKAPAGWECWYNPCPAQRHCDRWREHRRHWWRLAT